VLLIPVEGCATFEQRAGSSDVRTAVEARSGKRVVLHLTPLQYNAMQLGVFDLVRAREQQMQAAIAYIATLLEYWLAHTDRVLLQKLSEYARVPSTDSLCHQSEHLSNDMVLREDIPLRERDVFARMEGSGV
jgi:hypothetical protein